MSYTIGPQEECINCGESKAAVRASQSRGGHHVIYCATVDYFGECEAEFDRHRFIWTKRDQEAADAEEARWEGLARAIEAEELIEQAAKDPEGLALVQAILDRKAGNDA